MNIIKEGTYLGKQLLAKSRRCEGTTLREVYGRYSANKERAFADCLAMCEADGGTGFAIISHNTNTFSVRWYCKDGLRIEIRDSSYLVVK